MADTLTALTIAELFKELTRVEQAIRDCDPLFHPVGDHAALSPRLIDLAVEEHQICDELARRRASLRVQLESRLQGAKAPITRPTRNATFARP
jgi:hypothetical protein